MLISIEGICQRASNRASDHLPVRDVRRSRMITYGRFYRQISSAFTGQSSVWTLSGSEFSVHPEFDAFRMFQDFPLVRKGCRALNDVYQLRGEVVMPDEKSLSRMISPWLTTSRLQSCSMSPASWEVRKIVVFSSSLPLDQSTDLRSATIQADDGFIQKDYLRFVQHNMRFRSACAAQRAFSPGSDEPPAQITHQTMTFFVDPGVLVMLAAGGSCPEQEGGNSWDSGQD